MTFPQTCLQPLGSPLLTTKSYCNLYHLGRRWQGPCSLIVAPKDKLWVNPLRL